MAIDFNDLNFLPWVIPAGPLLAFFIIALITNRSRLVPATSHEYGGHHPDYEGMDVHVATFGSRVASIAVGLVGVLWALFWSFRIILEALGTLHFGADGNIFASAIDWIATGESFLTMGVLVDPLTVVMLFFVSIAVLMIFIYSIGYMAHDPRQSRFFALISLFAGAMFTLVVADNLLLLFIGWEVMGLCSYMLIGFWTEKESAYKAAIKAFTTTRIADVVMLLGIVYLFFATGTLSFREILYNPDTLSQLAQPGTALLFGGLGLSAAALIGIFLIIGTIGKSAQFPLHVWLPDAMEGPTPVSAMIHAAAMVSAGIYAIIRMYPLLSAGADPHHGVFNQPLILMAVVGAFTALFAATMAVAQRDVKAVLAYSTISQLGFMMAALGIGAYIAAAFHLMTHAFFKALLFMAAGSVIHGMEHGEHHVHEHHDASHEGHDAKHHAGHHHFDPQDMFNMGGLRRTMPVTFWTFLLGGMSLAGFPLLTAGFWSKDEILADAWLGTSEGYGPHALVFVLLAVAAFLTAFYTMRQLGLTFMGEPRTEEAHHANLGRGVVSLTMTLPLIILAFFAVVIGFVGVPKDFAIPPFSAIFAPEYNQFKHFVIESLHPNLHFEAPPFNWIPVLTSFAVALGGIFVGWWMYWRKPLQAGEADPLVGIIGERLHTALYRRYYLDDIYGAVFVAPSKWLADQALRFDVGIIDGLLALIARVATWIGDFAKVFNTWLIDGVGDGIPQYIFDVGGWLRRFQNGRIQYYLLGVLMFAIIIGIVLALSTGAVTAQ
jgi:NADH-quinone oxidoreductase subunit L